MSIVDLSSRITNEWDTFSQNIKSCDSYIYISKEHYSLDDGPASIDLTVGDVWFDRDDHTPYVVSDQGVIIRPFQSILIETSEHISLPYNIFGLVTGKGNQIFKGAFVSTGKINPAFNSKLKIGIYNGSKKTIKLSKGAGLCTCVFFQMESNLSLPLKKRSDSSYNMVKPISFWRKCKNWLWEHRVWLVALIAMIGTLGSAYLSRNFIGYDREKQEMKDKIRELEQRLNTFTGTTNNN